MSETDNWFGDDPNPFDTNLDSPHQQYNIGDFEKAIALARTRLKALEKAIALEKKREKALEKAIALERKRIKDLEEALSFEKKRKTIKDLEEAIALERKRKIALKEKEPDNPFGDANNPFDTNLEFKKIAVRKTKQGQVCKKRCSGNRKKSFKKNRPSRKKNKSI